MSNKDSAPTVRANAQAVNAIVAFTDITKRRQGMGSKPANRHIDEQNIENATAENTILPCMVIEE